MTGKCDPKSLIHRQILDSLSEVLILSLDTSYHYLYFNDVHVEVMSRAYGTQPRLGEDIFSLITNKSDRERSLVNYTKALQGEAHSTLEEYGDIQRSFYKTTYQPLMDEQGSVIGVTAMAKDVTAQIQAEMALAASEERFRSIFENNAYGICLDEVIYDMNGEPIDYRILDVNNAFGDILGLDTEKVIGSLASEVYGNVQVPFIEIFAEVARTGVPQVFETFYEPTGKYVRISSSCQGKGRFSNVISDITESKLLLAKQEQNLKYELERTQELETLYSASRTMIEEDDFERVIRMLYEMSRTAMKARMGFVALIDKEGMVKYLHLDYEGGKKGSHPEAMPFERVWPQVRPLSSSLFLKETDDNWKDLMGDHQEPFRNILITPLRTSSETFGVLCLADAEEETSDRQVGLVEGIGNIIAIAIKKQQDRWALYESERRYDAFLNTHTDFMFVKDESLHYTFVNDAMANYLGIPKETIIGMDDHQLLGEEGGRNCSSSDLKALSTDTTVVTEEILGDKVFETTKFPIKMKNSERLLGGIIRDITNQKRAMEIRERNEARLNSLVNILQHPVMTIQQFLDYALEEAIAMTSSELGYIYYYNEETRQFILNTWSKDVMDQCRVMKPETCYELDKTGLWGEAVRQRRAIIVNDFMADNPLKKGFPAGHVQLRRYMTTPVFSNDQVVAVVGMANKVDEYDQTDVLQLQLLMESVWRETEHRRTQEELKRIEWMLTPQRIGVAAAGERFLEDTQGYGDLTQLNHEGTILRYVGWETLHNLTADYLDLLGTSSAIYEANGDYAMGIFESGWCRLMDRASRKLCGNVSNSAALVSGSWLCHESCWTDCSKLAIERREPVDITCNGGIHLYAVPIIAGETVIGAINFGYGDPPTDQARLFELSKLYALPFEELNLEAARYDSRPPYIIEMARRRLSETARLIGLLVLGKQAEERQAHLNDQLRQSQKMEAIGQLAGGIAHDFNNVLQAIMGYAQLLKPQAEGIVELDEGLDEIYRCGERASSLTRQLLAFSRRQIMRPENLDLNVVVGNLQSMLKRVIGEHITLKWFPGSHLGMVHADISMMEQVLVNLCVNARDAMKEGGVLTLETQNVLIDDYYSSNNIWATPGRYILLSVTDTGIGMSEEVKEHIFEPFFTTKPEGQGTGLGLSTVYGIVKQHNGMITAYSEPGKGTTIKVYYPMTERKAVEVGTMIRPQVHGGNETILLAEDDSGVRALVVKILERAGYHVLIAKNGFEAVAMFQNNRKEISLLLLDVVMPGMGGHEAFERIEQIQSGLPVIFTSGYSENAVHTDFVLHEGLKLLQKPYSPDALLVLVRQTLDSVEA